MNTSKRPVRTTVLYGLICGLLFFAMGIFFEYTIFWPIFFRLAIFTCLSVYSLILASWTNTKRISVIFPLFFLMFFIFSGSSTPAFLLLCLGMLSWIRSGICFQSTISKSLGAEIFFSIGGGAIIASLSPYSSLTWALGIWAFFLVQSLYFILMTDLETAETAIKTDTFEDAKIKAEAILKC